MLHAHVQGRDVVVWPLFHPAAALHVPSLAAELRADARALGPLLQGARSVDPSPAPAPVPAPAPAPDEPDTGEPQLAFDV
jgi:hypothetical protein